MQVTHTLLSLGATLLSVFWVGQQVHCSQNLIQHVQTEVQIHNGSITEGTAISVNKSKLRSRRQLFRKKRKQSTLLFALNQLVLDTVNDTSIAYRNISTILSDQFGGGNSMKDQVSGNDTVANITMTSTSSNRTKPIFSMQQLFDLLGKNYRGLVKLFNQEFRSAISDSNRNVARYRMEFRDAVKSFFIPNSNFTANT